MRPIKPAYLYPMSAAIVLFNFVTIILNLISENYAWAALLSIGIFLVIYFTLKNHAAHKKLAKLKATQTMRATPDRRKRRRPLHHYSDPF